MNNIETNNNDINIKIDEIINDLYKTHGLEKNEDDEVYKRDFTKLLKTYGIKLILGNYTIPFVKGHFFRKNKSNNSKNIQKNYKFSNKTKLKHIISLFKFDIFLKGIIRNIIEEFELYLRGQLNNFIYINDEQEFIKSRIFIDYKDNSSLSKNKIELFNKLLNKNFTSNKVYNKFFFSEYKNIYITNWSKIDEFLSIDFDTWISKFSIKDLFEFIKKFKNKWIIKTLFSKINESEEELIKYFNFFTPIINNLRNKVAHNIPIFKFKCIDEDQPGKEEKLNYFKKIINISPNIQIPRIIQMIDLLFALIVEDDSIFQKEKYKKKIREKLKELWNKLEDNKYAINYLKEKMGIS